MPQVNISKSTVLKIQFDTTLRAAYILEKSKAKEAIPLRVQVNMSKSTFSERRRLPEILKWVKGMNKGDADSVNGIENTLEPVLMGTE